MFVLGELFFHQASFVSMNLSFKQQEINHKKYIVVGSKFDTKPGGKVFWGGVIQFTRGHPDQTILPVLSRHFICTYTFINSLCTYLILKIWLEPKVWSAAFQSKYV